MLVDVSYFNRPINWPLVTADCVMVRGPIGDRWVDDDFHSNWAGAKTRPRQGVYCVLIRNQSGAAQALNIFHQTGADFGTEAVALDVERTQAERDAIAAGTLIWDRAAYTAMLFDVVQALTLAHPIRIYTSKVEWEAMTTQPEWAARFLNWIAHYSTRITAPDVPAGWTWDWWQYGQAPMAGAAGLVDVTRENGIPMTTIAPGAGHGMGAEQPGRIIPILDAYKAAGVMIKGITAIENPGLCRDAYNRGVKVTASRFKNKAGPQGGERWENGQDADLWSDDETSADAVASIQQCFDRSNPWERAGITHWIPGINEFNPGRDGIDNKTPETSANWTAIGKLCIALCNEATRRDQEYFDTCGMHLRLILPNCPQGAPQYWQMQQFLATGAGDVMHERGDLFGMHEGPFPWEAGPQAGQGDLIPGAPYVPAHAGSGTGRIHYWILAGLTCDFIVTECYDGLGLDGEILERMRRMRMIDGIYRPSPQYQATTYYMLAPDPNSRWHLTDFTPVFDVGHDGLSAGPMLAELIAQKDTPNPTENEMQPLYHAKALIDLMLRDAAGNPATDPLAQSPDGHVVLKGTTLHVYATGVTAGGYSNRVTVTADGKSVWGIATALQRV